MGLQCCVVTSCKACHKLSCVSALHPRTQRPAANPWCGWCVKHLKVETPPQMCVAFCSKGMSFQRRCISASFLGLLHGNLSVANEFCTASRAPFRATPGRCIVVFTSCSYTSATEGTLKQQSPIPKIHTVYDVFWRGRM